MDAAASESATDREAALQPGMVVGRYRLVEELGRGGMGVVYRAEDPALGRDVALKLLPPHLHADEEAEARLRSEARAVAALDHPNVCTVYEVGEAGGGAGDGAGDGAGGAGSAGPLFIAMACYEGETLERRLQRGPLATEEAVGLGVQVARGLGAAHR
ncbi:MAG: protein kinase, partial [Rhodothermales bacterium]|nr:protein kinase [Rhodothermales bacterium]